MKKNKTRTGIVLVFLETDLEKTLPYDESKLTPEQLHVFSALSSSAQEKIRAGYGAIIKDMDSDEKICEFNMENYQPPQNAIDSFARAILPMVQEFYSKEENRQAFDEYMAKKEKIQSIDS